MGAILLLDRLLTLNLDQALKCRDIYTKFLRLTEELIRFINNHQFIKGFQISTKEFFKHDPRTLASIDDYISILKQNQEESEIEIEENIIDETSPFNTINKLNNFEKSHPFLGLIKINNEEVYSDCEKDCDTIRNDEYYQLNLKGTDEEQLNKMYHESKQVNKDTKFQLKKITGARSAKKKKPNLTFDEDCQIKTTYNNAVLLNKTPILTIGSKISEKETSKQQNISFKKSVSYETNETFPISLVHSSSKKSDDGILAPKKESIVHSLFHLQRRVSKKYTKDFLPDFDEGIFMEFTSSYSK